MALDNRAVGNFITIYNGKFTIRVPQGTEGGIERVNKMGKLVTEKHYDSFTGKLVGIRIGESAAYGKSWIFEFQDAGEIYNLQLGYSNGFATAFLKMLPNIDLNKEMKIQPLVKKEGDKTKSSLFVSQGGVNIKHAYTKDNPNGLPQMEQITVKGVLVWDDTKRIHFLHEMVDRDIIPKLPKAAVAEKNSFDRPSTGGMEVDDTFESDDSKKADDDDLGF